MNSEWLKADAAQNELFRQAQEVMNWAKKEAQVAIDEAKSQAKRLHIGARDKDELEWRSEKLNKYLGAKTEIGDKNGS